MMLEKRKIPGISLGLIRNGKIIHARGYGYSNIEHRVPVKIETIFQSASVGKQFTSMAVMMLVEKGKIELDKTINYYFPDAPTTWNKITVRHLLTHTSGMADYLADLDLRADYTEEIFYKETQRIPLVFQPGEGWNYSNLGYAIQGFLIRRVKGQYFGDFLKENIFNPLGMTTARVISEADIIPNRAAEYILIDGELKNQPWVSPTFNSMADGSLYLTVYDMAKWNAALYTNQLLKNQTSFDAMWGHVKLNNGTAYPYGFGWTLKEAQNRMRIVEHYGIWQGFQSMIIRVLEEKLTMVFFANLNDQDVHEIARLALALYYAPVNNR
ncbi:unnamed protein product [Rotaria sordida]|uniref:Beta-lactamase-related domain-containing protein n=1 Tax=Rotaria sordida TaxID=392033 RepID=A0A815WBH3_9BILA|nr:unnamed protein product [Rotaria sordida]CAF1538759.1 unnamed protein product [Rotaria sordida]